MCSNVSFSHTCAFCVLCKGTRCRCFAPSHSLYTLSLIVSAFYFLCCVCSWSAVAVLQISETSFMLSSLTITAIVASILEPSGAVECSDALPLPFAGVYAFT